MKISIRMIAIGGVLALLLPAAAAADSPMLLHQLEIRNGECFYGHGQGALFREVKTFTKYGSRLEYVRTNVYVLVDFSGPKATIQSKVEAWVDRYGYPHSITVLRRQVEFRDDVQRENEHYRWLPHEEQVRSVALTGILDRKTLSIPYEKLRWRLDHMNEAVEREMSSEDPTKKEAARYWSDKIEKAKAALGALKTEIDAVPTQQAKPVYSLSTRREDDEDGLTDISMPWRFPDEVTTRTPEPGLTILSRDEVPSSEDTVQDVIDPTGFTPQVAALLSEKESDAVAAIEIAENIGMQFCGFHK